MLASASSFSIEPGPESCYVKPGELIVRWECSKDTVEVGDTVHVVCNVYHAAKLRIYGQTQWDKPVPEGCSVDSFDYEAKPYQDGDVMLDGKAYHRTSFISYVLRPASPGVMTVGGDSITFEVRDRNAEDWHENFFEIGSFSHKTKVENASFVVVGDANKQQVERNEVFLLMQNMYCECSKDFSPSRQKVAGRFAKKLQKATQSRSYAVFYDQVVEMRVFDGKSQLKDTVEFVSGSQSEMLLNMFKKGELQKCRDLVIVMDNYYDEKRFQFADVMEMCRRNGVRVSIIYINTGDEYVDVVWSESEAEVVPLSVRRTGGMFAQVKNRKELMAVYPQLLELVSSKMPETDTKRNYYYPYSKEDIQEIVRKEMAINGTSADLNGISIIGITDLSNLFNSSICLEFNGDISKWDVSRVTDMYGMFAHSHFNGDISNWDVSSVTSMQSMFSSSHFNGDISKWDVSKVTDMNGMFYECPCKVPSWYKR